MLFQLLTKSNRPYVKKHLRQNVPKHRHVATADSPYYTYVQSPMCDWLVEFLPYWLAPNLITLSGFSYNIVCVLLLVYFYGFDTEGPIGAWYSIWMGIAYFIYTTLDNMDGKQARRTGSGSPLGMLTDHGCDATTATILPFIFSRLVQVGTGLPVILISMIPTVPFYYLIYQEYYTGVLNLPFMSGPDDTSLMVTAVCWYTAWVGSHDFWAS